MTFTLVCDFLNHNSLFGQPIVLFRPLFPQVVLNGRPPPDTEPELLKSAGELLGVATSHTLHIVTTESQLKQTTHPRTHNELIWSAILLRLLDETFHLL